MKKQISILLKLCFLTLFLFALLSCDTLFSSSNENGSIRVILPGDSSSRNITSDYTKSDVTFFSLSLINQKTSKEIRNLTAEPGNEISINDIDSGTYIISIKGFKGEECIAYGKTEEILVEAGKTSTATITLYFNNLNHLSSIKISGKSVYTLDETFSPSDIAVTGYFDSGYTQILQYGVEYSLFLGKTNLNETSSNGTSSNGTSSNGTSSNGTSSNEPTLVNADLFKDDDNNNCIKAFVTGSNINASFPVLINVDKAVIISQTDSNKTITIDVTHSFDSDLGYKFYSSDNYAMEGKTELDNNDLHYAAIIEIHEGKRITFTYSNDLYYVCELTTTNNDLNGITTQTVTSNVFGGKIVGINATLNEGKYIQTGKSIPTTLENSNLFTITKTFEDGTVATLDSNELSAVSLDIESTIKEKIERNSEETIVGNIPATLSYATGNSSVSTQTSIPVKYESVAPTVSISVSDSTGSSDTSLQIAQYTGSVTLTPVVNQPKTYTVYGTSEKVSDTVSGQWDDKQNNNNGTISKLDASTTFSYTATTSPNNEYSFTTESLVTIISETIYVKPYNLEITNLTSGSTETFTLTNNQTQTLVSGTNYKLKLVNSSDKNLNSSAEITSGTAGTSNTNGSYTYEYTENFSSQYKLNVKYGEQDPLFTGTLYNTTDSNITSISPGNDAIEYTDVPSFELPSISVFKIQRYNGSSSVTYDQATSEFYGISCVSTEITEGLANPIGTIYFTITVKNTTPAISNSEFKAKYNYTLTKPTIQTDVAQTASPEESISIRCNALPSHNFISGDVKTEIQDTILYQWYSNTEENTTNGTEIEGANTSAYIVPLDITQKTYYYCIATAEANTQALFYCKKDAILSVTSAICTVEPSSMGDFITN